MTNVPVRAIGPTDRASGPPVSVSSPTPSRRAALAALTGGAVLAVGGPAAAAVAQAAHPDQALLELGVEYQRLEGLKDAAGLAIDAAVAACEQQEPPTPEALVLRAEDVTELEFPIRLELAGCVLEARHVDLLRAKPRRRRTQTYWKVVRPTGQAASTMVEIDEDEFASAPPDVEVIDTDLMRPCSAAQARADQIVAAWDNWVAACNQVSDAIGLPAASDAYDDACEAVRQCIDLITVSPATTLDGLRVKARILSDRNNGELPDRPSTCATDFAMMRAIVRDLLP